MLIGRILSSITLLIGLQAHAVTTTALSPEQRFELGKHLAESASASQWQQLWQRSRQAGHLDEQSNTPYFSLTPTQLIEAVKLTLSHPDQTSPIKQTQVLYRRDFSPRPMGTQANTSLNAVCLWVDWRTLPEHALSRPNPYLGQISLLLTRPCQ